MKAPGVAGIIFAVQKRRGVLVGPLWCLSGQECTPGSWQRTGDKWHFDHDMAFWLLCTCTASVSVHVDSTEQTVKRKIGVTCCNLPWQHRTTPLISWSVCLVVSPHNFYSFLWCSELLDGAPPSLLFLCFPGGCCFCLRELFALSFFFCSSNKNSTNLLPSVQKKKRERNPTQNDRMAVEHADSRWKDPQLKDFSASLQISEQPIELKTLVMNHDDFLSTISSPYGVYMVQGSFRTQKLYQFQAFYRGLNTRRTARFHSNAIGSLFPLYMLN